MALQAGFRCPAPRPGRAADLGNAAFADHLNGMDTVPEPAQDRPTPPRTDVARRIRRLATLPLVAVAVVLVLFDDLFRPWVKAAVDRIARLRLLRRFETFVATLSVPATMALFVIPVLVIWPLKLYALVLIGGGHVVSGAAMLVVAKIVGVAIAERLFAISREKLLSVRWFAWCFVRAVVFKDRVHAWLTRTSAWRTVRRWVFYLRLLVYRLRTRLGALVGGRGRFGRLVAAARFRLGRLRRARADTPRLP